MEVAKSQRGDTEGALKAWDSILEKDSVDDSADAPVVDAENGDEGGKAPVTPAEAPAATDDAPADGAPAEAPAAADGQVPVEGAKVETPATETLLKHEIKWRGQRVNLELSPDEHRDLLQKGYDYERLKGDADQIVAKRTDEALGVWSRKYGLVEEDPATKQFLPSAKGFIQFAAQYAGGPEAVLKAVSEVLNIQIPGTGPTEDEFAEEEKVLDPSDPVDSRRLSEIKSFRDLRTQLSDLKKQVDSGVTPLHERFREMDERSQKAQSQAVENGINSHMDAELKKANLELSKWQKDSLGWEAFDLLKQAAAAGTPISREQAISNAVQKAAADIQKMRLGAKKEAVTVVTQNRPKPKTVPPAIGSGGKVPDIAKKDLQNARYAKRGTNAGMQDALAAFEAIEGRDG